MSRSCFLNDIIISWNRRARVYFNKSHYLSASSHSFGSVEYIHGRRVPHQTSGYLFRLSLGNSHFLFLFKYFILCICMIGVGGYVCVSVLSVCAPVCLYVFLCVSLCLFVCVCDLSVSVCACAPLCVPVCLCLYVCACDLSVSV